MQKPLKTEKIKWLFKCSAVDSQRVLLKTDNFMLNRNFRSIIYTSVSAFSLSSVLNNVSDLFRIVTYVG